MEKHEPIHLHRRETERQFKKIIFSGNLKNSEKLDSLKASLHQQGFELTLESTDTEKTADIAQEHAQLRKRFAEISDASCEMLIVTELNPQTLMEIAVAVAYAKPFYFLHTLPSADSYGYEEVACLRPMALNGSLDTLAEKIRHPVRSYETNLNETVPHNSGSVAICCSMKFRDSAEVIQAKLAEKNIPAYIPAIENHETATLSEQEFAEFKLRVMRTYFQKIKHPHIRCTLVLNYPKHGIEGYIGPNTLMEMAVATAAHKQNYILYNLSDQENLGIKPAYLLAPQLLDEACDFKI